MKQYVSLQKMLEEADGLDAKENPEYLRGMCELMARCFPTPHTFTDERVEEIKRLLNRMVSS